MFVVHIILIDNREKSICKKKNKIANLFYFFLILTINFHKSNEINLLLFHFFLRVAFDLTFYHVRAEN